MTHQISALVSQDAYDNYQAIPRGKRSQWIDKCMRKAPSLMEQVMALKRQLFEMERALFDHGYKVMREYNEDMNIQYEFISAEIWYEALKQKHGFIDEHDVEAAVAKYWAQRGQIIDV